MGIRLGAYKTDALGLLLIAFLAACALLSSAWITTLLPEQADLSWIVAATAIFALLIVAVVLSNWVLGVYLLAAVLPFENMLTFGPYASGIKVLALLMFCALGLRLLRDRELFTRLKLSLQQPLVHAVVAFSLWSMVSILWASVQEPAFIRTGTFVGLLGLMLAIGLLRKEQLNVLWAIIAGATVLSVPVSYLLTDSSASESGRFSAGGDPNDYACLLAIVFLVSFYGLMRRSKVAAYVLAVVILIGILISQSRTGLVALAAAPLLGLFLPRLTTRLAGRTAIAYSLAVVAFAGLVFAVPSIGEQDSERYATLSEYQSEDTWSGRWSLWQGATQVIAAQPILGVGAGNFPYVASTYSARVVQMESEREGSGVAHNMFLSVGSELGLVGLALFLTILFLALRRALGFAQRSSTLGTGLFLGLIVFMIAGMTLTWEYQKIGYFLYGSVLALQLHHQALQRHGLRRKPGEV